MLAEPMSAVSMAAAIAALYERDLAAIGAAARAKVLRQFTWTRAFHAQLSIYASLFGLQRQPVTDATLLGMRSPTS
jgi:alpha-1,6-mannosyltransferase